MCRDSSVGRALDWRSKGPRFDPGSRQFFYFILDIQEWKCFSVIRPRFNTYSSSNSKVQNNEKSFSQNWETFQSQFFIQYSKISSKIQTISATKSRSKIQSTTTHRNWTHEHDLKVKIRPNLKVIFLYGAVLPLYFFLLCYSKIELENSIAEKAFISLRARCEELFR